MKRQLFPSVEALEMKALLSQFGVAAVAPQQFPAQPIEGPTPTVRSELAISLTTNQSVYTVGQNVQMTLTATNSAKHAITVGVGPSTTGFSISQNAQVIWQSSSGPEPLYIEVRVLQPGQSFTATANWTAMGTGTFVVSNQMAPPGTVATFSVETSKPVAAVAPPVTPPVNPPGASALAISLTTNQSSYTVGQNVQMTLTETNDSNQAVNVAVGPGLNAFFISQNGQIIWRSNAGAVPFYIELEVLGPGRSLTLTANWTATATGTFVVSNEIAPQGPVATFSVTGS
jgi:hypothetical protein